VAYKKRPEIRAFITARILHGNKFYFAHLYINVYSYLLINSSDVINDTTECRLMT